MGSQQDMQQSDADNNSSSWMLEACRAVQDINDAFHSAKDDVQPLDDAPNYQALCGTARQACCQAEGSMCNSAAQQTIKELDCMCQLSTATLQLSSAVCCDPAVALPLISSGMHAAALDQLKSAVKSLTNLWASCMTQLQQQEESEGGGAPGASNSCTSSQHAWQVILPSLAAALKHLLHMSVTSAEFVGGSSSSQQVPREMCSMSALNLSWANMIRLLVAIPEGIRMQALDVQDLLHGLQCALHNLNTAVMDLAVQARDRQEVLVRFWLQSVSRLTSAAWEDAAQQALSPLLQLTLVVYDAVIQQRPEFAAVQSDILQQLLQPRLLACLSRLLSSSTDPTAFQTKLDLLLQLPEPSAACCSNPYADLLQQDQQQRLKVQVLVVLDVLQHALPGWPRELIALGCKQLLTWSLNTAGQELFVSLLHGTEAAGAMDGMEAGQAAAAAPELAGDAACLELMQSVMQGCLVGMSAGWCALQEMQQQQQVELLIAVNRLALSPHPLVSFLAQQLLADLIAAAGSRDLAALQLAVLHRLLGATAAAVALPGAGWEAQRFAEAVSDLVIFVLQACDQAFALEWLQQHVTLGLGSTGGSSSNSMWLDAGACSLLVQECAVLQRVTSAGPQLMPLSHTQLEECWTQLWSTAQQVAELLELHSSINGTGSTTTQQPANSLLVLHQLSWLFAAMHALLQLCSSLDAAAASNLKQGATQMALGVLAAVSDGGLGLISAAQDNQQGTESPAGVPAAALPCILAVLRLLGTPGQLLVPEGRLQELLVVLRGLGQHHEGLHVALAGVLGALGTAAADPTFQELFQHLLSSPHWAVKHAAFEALLQLLRHGGLSTGIVRLLPPGMKSSATEATPEVINTVKAHLHKQPDPQAQATFAQHYPQLAAQQMRHLAAFTTAWQNDTSRNSHAEPSRCTGTKHSTCFPSAGQLSTQLQALQELLAAVGSTADVDASKGPGVSSEQVQHAGLEQAGLYADSVGGAQGLLTQAAKAAKSLQAAEQALSTTEADVRLLLSAASAAARDKSLGADGILLVSNQAAHMAGNVASMVSRLRALQDALSILRR